MRLGVAHRVTAVCRAPVVTVSTLMRLQGIDSVDLMKVDVEGAELDVLRGIRQEDWSKIKQIVMEVHDVQGRLQAACEVLQQQGYTVHTEAQGTSTVRGYRMTIPRSLALHYVYATRPASSSR